MCSVKCAMLHCPLADFQVLCSCKSCLKYSAAWDRHLERKLNHSPTDTDLLNLLKLQSGNREAVQTETFFFPPTKLKRLITTAGHSESFQFYLIPAISS